MKLENYILDDHTIKPSAQIVSFPVSVVLKVKAKDVIQAKIANPWVVDTPSSPRAAAPECAHSYLPS